MGLPWLQERWPVRVVATASGSSITWLALLSLFETRIRVSVALPLYLAWMVAAYVSYRHWRRDVFVLAGGVLSAILVVTVFLSNHMLGHDAAGSFLFIGLVVIGLSAVGGWWLKSVAAENAP